MPIKYALYPGKVRSINDGDWHFISSIELARLYKVKMSECITVDLRSKASFMGLNIGHLKSLHPRSDGKYPLFGYPLDNG
jgi:hypothetical protein